MIRFYLGTHRPYWLRLARVPLFISDRRLSEYTNLPVALKRWALDSGGFSELSMHGSWDYGPTPKQYVRRVRRYRDEVGMLDWAAQQDWMCEPRILRKTGLTVLKHQTLGIKNYIRLKSLDSTLPFIPVLQGYTISEYLRHVDMFDRAGIDLTQLPLVGVGSVCRRQSTNEIDELFRVLHGLGLRMHGFGVKTGGLAKYARYLKTSDSMAWSYGARFIPPLPWCAHGTCVNCFDYAHIWRKRMLRGVGLIK